MHQYLLDVQLLEARSALLSVSAIQEHSLERLPEYYASIDQAEEQLSALKVNDQIVVY